MENSRKGNGNENGAEERREKEKRGLTSSENTAARSSNTEGNLS
jgi:hypothetical protein